MKITERKTQTHGVRFCDLEVGDCFLWSDGNWPTELYLKIDTEQMFSLTECEESSVSPTLKGCVPVDAEIIYSIEKPTSAGQDT